MVLTHLQPGKESWEMTVFCNETKEGKIVISDCDKFLLTEEQ